ETLKVALVPDGSMSSDPGTAPLVVPINVTSSIGLALVPPKRKILATVIGLLKATLKPVAVGVKAVTTRPRVVMALLVPVMVGFVEVVSVAVIVWLPPVFRVTLKAWTPLSLPAPVENV